jgi:hypothetical protein
MPQRTSVGLSACFAGVLASLLPIALWAQGFPAVPLTHLCQFTTGPRSGTQLYYGKFPPVPVGTSCYDGAGSYGLTVPESGGPPSDQPGTPQLSDLCLFNSGPRAGQVQAYPQFPAVAVGTPCHDGFGSNGLVIPMGGSPSGQQTRMTFSCQFTNGPLAGRTISYATIQGVRPIPVGSPCQDGQGSTGFGIPDGTQ